MDVCPDVPEFVSGQLGRRVIVEGISRHDNCSLEPKNWTVQPLLPCLQAPSFGADEPPYGRFSSVPYSLRNCSGKVELVA